MTEKQKRDAGMLYDANYDKALGVELTLAKDKCYEYNLLKPSQYQERNTMISEIFGSVGSILAVLSPFVCDYGYNIHVGKNFFANHGLVILDAAKVTFGNDVFIAPNCGFHTAGHPLDYVQRNQGLEYAYPITVGDNVWFGASVSVMPGVTIGSNVVIASGSVVTKDIPDNVLAMGNPCRVRRSLTTEEMANTGKVQSPQTAEEKEALIKKYFAMWVHRDFQGIEELFAENIYYSECYGPEYFSLAEIYLWIEDMLQKQVVLQWCIKSMVHSDNTTVVEWYFQEEQGEEISGFDGVSLIEFHETTGKITVIKEFQSNSEHYAPFHGGTNT